MAGHAEHPAAAGVSSFVLPSLASGAAAQPDAMNATAVSAAQADAESHVHKLRSMLASGHAASPAPSGPAARIVTSTIPPGARARATSDDASVGEEVGALKRALAKARMDNAQLVFRVSSLSNALEKVHTEAQDRGQSSLRDAIVAERTAGATVHEAASHSVEHMPPTVKQTAAAFQVRAPPPPPPGISASAVVEEDSPATPDAPARQRSLRSVRRGTSQSSMKVEAVPGPAEARTELQRTDTSSSGRVTDAEIAAEVWDHSSTVSEETNLNTAPVPMDADGDSQPPPSPPPMPPPEQPPVAQRSITLTRDELRSHIAEAVSRAVSEAVGATQERMRAFAEGIAHRDEQLTALRQLHDAGTRERTDAHAVVEQLHDELEDLRRELQAVSRASAEKDERIERLLSKLQDAEDAATATRIGQEQALIDAAAAVRSEYSDWLKYHESRLDEAREAASAEILQRELVEARMRMVTNELETARAANKSASAELAALRDTVAAYTADSGLSIEDRIAAARREWDAAARTRDAEQEAAFNVRIQTVRAEVQTAAAVATESACNAAASSALSRASIEFRQQLTDALRSMKDSMEAEREAAVRVAVQGARHEYEGVMREWEEATERWRRETIATCESTLHGARAQVIEARGQVAKLEGAIALKDGEIAQLRAALSSSTPSSGGAAARAGVTPIRVTPIQPGARRRTPMSRPSQKKAEHRYLYKSHRHLPP